MPPIEVVESHGRVRLRFAVAEGWADVLGRGRHDGYIEDGEVNLHRVPGGSRPARS